MATRHEEKFIIDYKEYLLLRARAEAAMEIDPHAGEEERLTEEKPLRVRSKRSGKVRHLWPVALLTALLLIYFIARPFWKALSDLIFGSLFR